MGRWGRWGANERGGTLTWTRALPQERNVSRSSRPPSWQYTSAQCGLLLCSGSLICSACCLVAESRKSASATAGARIRRRRSPSCLSDDQWWSILVASSTKSMTSSASGSCEPRSRADAACARSAAVSAVRLHGAGSP